jgi:hypothetical protein
LLGGVQGLIDGARLVFERREPADALVRDLWQLLPLSTRSEIWLATFAYSNALRFHVAVVPRVSGPDFEDYVSEEKLGDYPEGSYERSLQSATESGNQAELDGLFTRRSRRQTLWLGVLLLLGFILVALVIDNQGSTSSSKDDKSDKANGGKSSTEPTRSGAGGQ